MANALSQFSRDLAAVIDATSPAIVAVHGRGRLPSSGIVWEPGLIVTAEETIARDADLALTLADGRRVEATLAGRDPSTDIAVLRFAGEARPIARGSAPELRPGHLAVAVGRAETDVIAALGIVALAGGPWHSSHGGKIDARLRFDLRLASTAEGGALVSADGALIGMAVHGPRRRVLAIPTATIARVVATIKEKGHVARGYLGVSLQSVPIREGEHHRRGAMVVTIDPAGPAQAGGLKQGDIIVAMDGEAVTGVRGVYQRLGPDSVGDRPASRRCSDETRNHRCRTAPRLIGCPRPFPGNARSVSRFASRTRCCASELRWWSGRCGISRRMSAAMPMSPSSTTPPASVDR
jgi:S1-C subfamily serine protease